MRGVIFDLDDTLYPHERFARSGLAAVAQYVAQEFRVPAGRAFTTMLAARNAAPRTEFQALCRTLLLPETIVPQLLAIFRAHVPSLWLHHDAVRALGELRREGWRLAILTNGLPDVQARKVDALGVRALVDHVIFAAEHADGGKPHPAAFAAVLHRLALPADRCVMVGDDVECDVAGGRRMGLHTIRMVTPGSAADAGGADAVLEFLSDVPAAAASLVDKVSAHAA